MSRSIGRYLVELLAINGIDTVFGIPGVHNLELYRGLADSSLRHVLVRHEQGAGFAADGYARMSGRPAAAFTISGPGLTNILTAGGSGVFGFHPAAGRRHHAGARLARQAMGRAARVAESSGARIGCVRRRAQRTSAEDVRDHLRRVPGVVADGTPAPRVPGDPPRCAVRDDGSCGGPLRGRRACCRRRRPRKSTPPCGCSPTRRGPSSSRAAARAQAGRRTAAARRDARLSRGDDCGGQGVAARGPSRESRHLPASCADSESGIRGRRRAGSRHRIRRDRYLLRPEAAAARPADPHRYRSAQARGSLRRRSARLGRGARCARGHRAGTVAPVGSPLELRRRRTLRRCAARSSGPTMPKPALSSTRSKPSARRCRATAPCSPT